MDCWCDCSYIPWDVQGLDQFYLIYYYIMDKLLQLLNEYQTQRESKFKFSGYDERSMSFLLVDSDEVLWEETIISKKFWFIERLVDQNKVEFDRARDRSDFPLLYAGWWEFYSDSEVIIATLSVEDDPISFLISILK